ncbi:MAG TPA: hypothetical protein PKY77_22810 [Phycisphaerae bacterium]|nr:hypothetical protein [Phycisphaerae bacterium]HRY68442.1 hypothetical protein [Phycisphaerae bacterium]HSA28523.1 hypothetical protein [Phycisphaerae bacterium]
MSRATPRMLLAAIPFLTPSGGSGAAPPPEPEVLRRWTFNTPADLAACRDLNHLKDLAVVDGRLRMTITGPDAFFSLPPVDVPFDGLRLRVRMRSDRDGYAQVYWQLADAPGFTEARQLTENTPARRAVPPGNQDRDDFLTVEFPLGGPLDAGKQLTGVRLDVCNGNVDGTVEIAAIELVRMPAMWAATLSCGSAHTPIGAEVELKTTLRQTSGRSVQEGCYFILADGNARTAKTAPSAPAALTTRLRFDRPGVHTSSVRILGSSHRSLIDLQTSVIVGEDETLPLAGGIRNDHVRLDFISAADGRGLGAARWMIRDHQDRWRLAGWLLPLIEVAVCEADGSIVRRRPTLGLADHTSSGARLSGVIADLPGWLVEFKPRILEKNGLSGIEVVATLAGPEGGRLLDFSAPVLLADRCDAPAAGGHASAAGDPLDRYAVFGGLELLEPGWRSSSDRAVGRRFADRWTPHPFKVTLPMMAVEACGLTSALMWQPRDAWCGRNDMPAATFASPNFLDGQSNHLLRLSAPSIPAWREENSSLASRPFVMAAQQPVTLRAMLYAECDAPVVGIGRRWYEFFGTPVGPPTPHDAAATSELIAQHFGQTMYWPAEKGWRHHWYLDKRSEFVPLMAGELISHNLSTGKTLWLDRTGLVGRTLIDTMVPLAVRVAEAGPARAAIAGLRSDGTWPYADTPQVRDQTRQFSKGEYDSLGEVGSTSLGTCVMPTLLVLHHALLTGDEESSGAALKALEAMRRFRVPRGAQTWEVHKDTPDIRAAALAVEAYQLGYRLTGEERYLDEASYWAWSGVPFLYSWHVPIEATPGTVRASRSRDDWQLQVIPAAEAFRNPNRQVTPYGSVPVLGPSFYAINWFGVIVQWCGLEWAAKVIELDRDRPDPLLRVIAEGVVGSGWQQTFDREPWVGLYPDVWDLQANRAQGALISAQLPLACLKAQGCLPRWTDPWTRVVPDGWGRNRWHVSGWGSPPDLRAPHPDSFWAVSLDFPPGQPNELVIARVSRPERVHVGGRLLDARVSAVGRGEQEPGWAYHAALQALVIRFIQPAPKTEVLVQW